MELKQRRMRERKCGGVGGPECDNVSGDEWVDLDSSSIVNDPDTKLGSFCAIRELYPSGILMNYH